MSVTKVINIEVKDGELKGLEKDLQRVGNQFDKVDNEAKKAGTSIKDVGENGGAIALLDELTGGLATKVRDAAEASKLFNTNLKATRTALIATGVGAFVVALGLVVGYWDEIVEFITDANKKLEEQIMLNERNIDVLDNELKILDVREKILEKEGKSTENIKKQKEQVILLQQEQNLLLLENLKTQLLREKAQVQEVTLWEKIKIAALQAAGAYDSANEAIVESIIGDEEQRQRLAEIEDSISEATLRREQLKLDLLNLNSPSATTSTGTREETVDRPQNLEVIGTIKRTEIIDPTTDPLFINEKNLLDAIDELREGAANDEIIREQMVANAKKDIAMNTLSLIGALVEDGSKVGKGVALAQTVIAGIEGVQNAYKTAQASPITIGFPAYPVIQAGLAGAFSAVQIKKILSTDPTGRTTPNLGGGNVAGAGTGAPSFNVVGQSGVNQLAQSLSQDQQPIQAFVVGSQVTTQQELDNNIVQTASIGG